MAYIVRVNDGTYVKQTNQRGNPYEFVKVKIKATKWKTKDKANAIINSTLSKCKKLKGFTFTIEPFDDEDKKVVDESTKKKEKTKEVSKTETKTLVEKKETEKKKDSPKIVEEKKEEKEEPRNFIEDSEEDASIDDINIDFSILEITKEVIGWGKGLEKKKKDLIEQLRQADLEIVDIEHAMEFYNFSASDGYKIYKKFQNVKKRRRFIKDELQMLSVLEQTLSIDLATKLEKNINGLNNRKYTPRTNFDLFA